ncbi:APC family permease [Arthrobacter rhombi]|uniref:Amino acid permease family protein n=1 Tax=Arthrobacter rhombi TaxID=71253 RepID=A0A1R4G8U0_9MICC|nr:APC family permease [Arthrobacter rhombi]SJM64650.1 amino acid permease family protein [Arthrobacter rhombi]
MSSPTSPPTKVKVELDRGLKPDIGKIGLLFTGVGSIIGSGWLFGAFEAASLVGPAAIISWILGAVMIIIVALNYADLGVMFPVAGGVIRFPHYSFGSFASYTSGWITWLAVVATVPIEVLAAVQYASSYLPWLMHTVDGTLVLTGGGIAVSVVLVAVFCVINMFGVKLFARFNNVLVWWKLGVILLVIVVLGILAFHPGHFHEARFGGFMPQGVGPIFAALPAAGIVFSYLGFRQGVEFAGETTNPQKNVPFALIGSIVITGIIYVLLQIAFIGAVPDSMLSNGWAGLSFTNDAGPWAEIAIVLGAMWLGIILYVDAVVSPADTGLIYTALSPRLSYSQARVGNAPSALQKLSKRGVPWVGLLVMFVVACFMFLPFPSWAKLVGFITTGTVLSFGSGPVTVAALRRQLPDQDRPYRLPGGDVLPFLGFLCANLIVYWTGWDTNWKLFLAVAIGYIVLSLHYAFSDRSKIPPLQMKSGWWMLLWMGGLALLSWIGHYGDGSLDLLTFGWGELGALVLTAIVFWVAVTRRLSPQEVVDNVERTHMVDPGAGDEAESTNKTQ